jgi:hypothetical protein
MKELQEVYMLTRDVYNKLKQTNITKRPEVTKERVKGIWDALEKHQRQEIFSVSGLKKTTLDRTNREGNISAKLTTALAEVTRIDPYYIAAMTDEKSESVSDHRIESFLISLGYQNVLREVREKAFKPTIVQEPDNKAPAKPEPESTDKSDISLLSMAKLRVDKLTDDERNSLDSMSEEEMLYLLKSLALRSRFSDEAKALSGLLKLILIN